MIKRLWYSLLSNDKPQDKNVIWIDTSNSESFTLKLYRNGGWKPLQVVGTSRDMIERELTGYVTSHYHSYDRIINKPTTLEGYGITDCFNKKEVEKLLDNKVTKVDGMSLTSNNFSDKYKKMLDDLSTSYYNKKNVDNLLNEKQDVISDLESIREGSKKGNTALQSFTETDPIYLKDKPFIALKSDLLNDNNLVHKEGDEDIRGSKRFEHIRINNFGIYQGDNNNHSVYIDYYYDESNYLPILHFSSEEDWLTILDNIADPVYDFHAANKHYVDEGLATKQNALTDTDGGYGQRVAKLETGKQDTLTAGNGISIKGGVIGVTAITESESQPNTSLWLNPSEDEETDVTYNRSQIDAMVGAKQDTLQLTVKDNGNIVLANLQGQSKEFMPATPSGDPMHYAYEAAGAVWNGTGKDITRIGRMTGDTIIHKAGYWYLNELGDISNEEMRKILIQGRNSDCLNCGTSSRAVSIPLRTNLFPVVIPQNIGWSNIESLVIVGDPERSDYTASSSLYKAIYSAFKVCRKILTIIESTRFSMSAEQSLINLEFFKLKSMSLSQYINSPYFREDCILYMITNEEATSPITITLHADAYTRAMANADIVAALQAHPNVSLASA